MGIELIIYRIEKGDIISYCKVVNPWKEGEVEKTEGDSSHQHYSIDINIYQGCNIQNIVQSSSKEQKDQF